MTAPPARSRGTLALLAENCTVCNLCVKECPDLCIEIDAHPETREPPGGGRPRTTSVLDGFRIDLGLCMYCGICVDVCPFDALFWSPAFEHAATTRDGLVHDRDLLRRSLDAVPLPPAHDPHGEPSAEQAKAGPPGGAPDRD